MDINLDGLQIQEGKHFDGQEKCDENMDNRDNFNRT